MMNGRLSAAASIAKHGERVASVAADSVLDSQRMIVMSQHSMPSKTTHLLFTICVLCLVLSTGCAFSKNLLGKSNLKNPGVSAQTATILPTAQPDCAVPVAQPKALERTAYPVASQTAQQAAANVAPVNNGTPQQSVMQQPVAQQQPAPQPQYVQQQPAMQQPSVMQQPQPAVPQQTAAFVQQSVQQPLAQPTVVGVATQGQGQTVQLQPNQPQAAPAVTAEIAPAPNQYQSADPNTPRLPAATIIPSPDHPKEASGPEMTAAPASALRAQARSGSTAASNCSPGMVPSYGYVTDAISSPEKLAECEKQVFEMNQKLSELQFVTSEAKFTMDQMAERQKRLLIDNERLRRRAEMADKRYLEELDLLSEIVGEVVSQSGSGNKSSSASQPSRGADPRRAVPQSATGQSL